MTRERMDALVEAHYRAEERGDIDGIVDGFVAGAAHDVAGRPGAELRGGDEIAAYYRRLLTNLRIDRFEPVRRWHGERHVVDEFGSARDRRGNGVRPRRRRSSGRRATPARLRLR